MYTRTGKCRICGNTELVTVLDLGVQALTGTFPHEKNASITRGPLRLVKCMGGEAACGLLQLEHSYDLREMYGENYGYRSALNMSMVAHLRSKVRKILRSVVLNDDDLIVDIGSNDSTTLQAYPYRGSILVGIDPTGIKFAEHYPLHIQLISDFFSALALRERFPGKKAKIVTSFSMFYDLEDPIGFMRNRRVPFVQAYADFDAAPIAPRFPGIVYRPRTAFQLHVFMKDDPKGAGRWLLRKSIPEKYVELTFWRMRSNR